MYSQAVSDPIWDLLLSLDAIPEMMFCYLGGGTALALQLGHRISEDLDFFVKEGFDTVALKNRIHTEGLDFMVMNQTLDHLELIIQSIKVDIINERIPLKYPPVLIDSRMKNIKMADSRDIGRMKIMSIGSRGNKKDFIDLYCLTRDIISLDLLLAQVMAEDHGIRYSKLLFLKGLVDFEEADNQEIDLPILWDLRWENIKETLIKEVKNIAEKMM